MIDWFQDNETMNNLSLPTIRMDGALAEKRASSLAIVRG